MQATLAVTAIGHAIVASSFLAVAASIRRRRIPDPHQATWGILVWWTCLAGYLYLQAGLHLAAALWGPSLEAFLWSRLFAIPLLCAASGGLAYYILYLVTGRPWLRWPIALLYLLTAALFHLAVFVPLPTGLAVTPWLIELRIANTGLLRVVYALVGLPVILGSATLLATARRMEPPQRYRARMVGFAILAYVGTGLAAFTTANDVVKVAVLNGLGLVAAVLVLLAYHPPRWVAARVGALEPAALEEHKRSVEGKKKAFRKRGNELI